MAPTHRIGDLMRAEEARAPENQDAERLRRIRLRGGRAGRAQLRSTRLGRRESWSSEAAHRSSGNDGRLEELASCRCHDHPSVDYAKRRVQVPLRTAGVVKARKAPAPGLRRMPRPGMVVVAADA